MVKNEQGMVITQYPMIECQNVEVRMENRKVWINEGKSIEKVPKQGVNIGNNRTIFFVTT